MLVFTVVCSLAAMPVIAAKPSKVNEDLTTISVESHATKKLLTASQIKSLGGNTAKPVKKPQTKLIPTHINTKVINPDVAKKPAVATIRPVKPMASKAPQTAAIIKRPEVTQPVITKRFDDQRLAAIRDANIGAGAKAAKELGETARNIPGANIPGNRTSPDLGLGNRPGTGPAGHSVDLANLPGHNAGGYGRPEGTEYLPDLPDNRDHAPSHAALIPSGTIADFMAGATSTDATVTKTVNDTTGDVSVTKAWTQNGVSSESTAFFNDSGRLTSALTDERGHGGPNTISNSVTYYDEDGSVHTYLNAFEGSHSTYRRVTHLNSRGEVVSDTVGSGFDTVPGPLSPGRSGSQQDPNSDQPSQAAANWARQFDHSKKSGAPTVTYVNPGPDGAQMGLDAPRLMLPEDMLVINPSPENAGAQPREISAAQRAMLQRQLVEKVKGPGGHPGDPDLDVSAH